ncbi:hypothetical protein NQ318_009061 [Aromia moschata]|uniref:C2H2-type domain-containing protein n=1 Tax=Aromia moschata TaxID=1265417 RepID=A0AAV8YW50_9CUCU|nr:hypothetical protein NQ318_009061 [Aromia moschata]
MFQITTSDKISTMVCNQCVSKINNWHEYKQTCSRNQEKLEQWLNSCPSNNIADMSLQIKEEPPEESAVDTENTGDEPDDIVEVLVKNEPMDPPDEPMEEEYNELPPPLTPHPLEINHDSENSQDGGTPGGAANQDREEGSSDFQTADNLQFKEADQQKIQFAAGLKLLQKNATPISCEPLSKIELSYIEKCKAMVNMHRTLECACHNVLHPNLKGLLSHLRALRIWFPVFTCYNCMITFTDRSTFTRHNVRCPKSSLETLVKLSNLRKRSEVKTRLYQNFKCTSCKFMYSFHDDFCKHVDEDHAFFEPPIVCSCTRQFDNVEDYKDHVYVSCLVEYYCDICFITTKTLEEFQKHSVEVHDASEGFILLQDDNYKMRKPMHHKEVSDENVFVAAKRERRTSIKAPILEVEEDYDAQKKLGYPLTLSSSLKDCPICGKEYSTHHNMVRHYRTHLENGGPVKDVQDPLAGEDDSVYSCPDCGGMYRTPEWHKHLQEKHELKTCGECGKIFQFQSELDQHRSVHLNLKVYRDSKTQSYKTSMLSPGSEGEIMLMCEICEVIFTTKEELKQHKLTHGEDVVQKMEVAEQNETGEEDRYACKPCNKVYSSYGGIWDHNKKKHPEKKSPFVNEWPKQCTMCDKVCQTGAAYYRHKQIHEKDRIVAEGANVTTMKTPIVKPKREEAREDDESYHTCKRCFKVFSSKYNLKNHLKSHGISPTNRKIVKKCDICHQAFTSNELLAKHKSEEHKDEEVPTLSNETVDGLDNKVPFIFTCDVCVMTFTTKMALKKHKEKHAQEMKPPVSKHNQVYCKYCKVAFDSIALLTKHMHVEHDETAKPKGVKAKEKPKQFQCALCKKVFLTSSALSTHTGWHKRSPAIGEGGKPAKVLKQNKIIDKLANSVKVKQEPIEPAQFQCTTCLVELPNDTALQVHILEKHRSVSAIMLIPRCNICNKDFGTQDEYETHKRLHDFLERQKHHDQLSLQSMEAIANDGTPKPKGKGFPCKYCNAAFSRADTLGGHMRQYHKEYVQNEFKCTQCDRVFDKQNSLSIHLKVHEKQRSAAVSTASKPLFSCSICSMGFDLPKDLRAHTISAHPF